MCMETTTTAREQGGEKVDSQCAERKEECTENIPLLLRPMVSVYRATPKVCFPCDNINLLFIAMSATLLLGSVRLAEQAMISLGGWPESKITFEAAASVGSILHSTVLVPSLGVLLWTQKFVPSASMQSHPQWWQDAATALLLFCTGYMIYDSINYFIIGRWVPGVGPVLESSDYSFLGHHFATSFYMISSLVIGAGHLSAMILMFTGEFTNPIHNIFLISRIATVKLDCCNPQWLQLLYPYIEYTFSLLYCFFRIFIGPLCAAVNTYDLLFTKQGRANVPLYLTPFWLIMAWGVLIGSIPWIIDCLEMLGDGLTVKYHKDYDGEL